MEMELSKKKHSGIFLLAFLLLCTFSKAQTQLTFQAGVTVSEYTAVPFSQSDIERLGLFVQLGAEKTVHTRHSLLLNIAYACYAGASSARPRFSDVSSQWHLSFIEVPVGWRWYVSKRGRKLQYFTSLGIIPTLLTESYMKSEVKKLNETLVDGKIDLSRFYLGSFVELGAKQKLSEKTSLLLCLRGNLSLTRLRTTDGSKLGNYAALTPTLGVSYRL